MNLILLINQEITCMSWFKGCLARVNATEVAISFTQKQVIRVWLLAEARNDYENAWEREQGGPEEMAQLLSAYCSYRGPQSSSQDPS